MVAQNRLSPSGKTARVATYAGIVLFAVALFLLTSMLPSSSAEPASKAPTTVASTGDLTSKTNPIPPNQVYRAVEGLKKDNVFTYPTGEVALADELNKRLDGSSIGVVVLPGSATLESYNDLVKNEDSRDYYSFAAAVYEKVNQDKYRTIIVLSKNRYTSWSNQGGLSIEELLAGSSALNPEQILLSQDKIEDWNEHKVGEWLPWFGIPVGLIILVILGFISVDYFSDYERKMRLREKEKKAAVKKKDAAKREERKRLKEKDEAAARVAEEALASIPTSLRSRLLSLETWASRHVAPVDQEFAGQITSMADRFRLLFERLEERGTEQGRKVAMVSYTDMLGKVSAALSDKYYLDILAHPELWDDPEGRILQVKKAVAGVSFQLLENIKQVNAARDLDFQASLESMAGFMDNPRLEDIYGEEGK